MLSSRLACTLLLTCGVALSGVASTPASATTPDPADVVVLPRQPAPPPAKSLDFRFNAVSAQYAMYGVSGYEDYAPTKYTVVRLADGSIVSDHFIADPNTDRVFVSGSDIVEVSGTSSSSAGVKVIDAESGAVRGTLDIGGYTEVIQVAGNWTLVRRWDTQTQLFHAWIYYLDGRRVDLPATASRGQVRAVGGDGHHVFLEDDSAGTLVDVDVDEGTAQPVTAPSGGQWQHVVVGPTRLYNIRDPFNGTWAVSWLDRSSGATGNTQVATISVNQNFPSMLPYGDGLAIYTANNVPRSLRPIDLLAGTVQDPVASNLSDAQPLGDGRIAVIDGTVSPGRIAVVGPDGSETTVAPIPTGDRAAQEVVLNGDWVKATWYDGGTTVTSADGQQAWQPSPGPYTQSGDASIEKVAVDPATGAQTWRLSWPGGERTLTASNLTLGHGGKYLSGWFDNDAGGLERQVRDLRSNAVVATLAPDATVAVDGTRVWTWASASDGRVTRTDLDDPAATAQPIRVGAQPCASTAALAVRGRWAAFRCGNGFEIVDLQGVVPAWSVPYSASSGTTPVLGAGFVVWAKSVPGPIDGGPTVPEVEVSDLTSAHNTRSITDPGISHPAGLYAADEAGSDTMVYIGRDHQPRVVHLPWLGQAPEAQPDTSAPVLSASTLPPTVIASTSDVPLSFAWTFDDPGPAVGPASGVASYDVRMRTRTAPGPYGAWTVAGEAVPEARLYRTLAPGQGVCASVRARDAVGNLSEWSEERCSFVDGAIPSVPRAAGPAATPPLTGGPATFHYQASDDQVEPLRYNLVYRVAAPGHGFGNWYAPDYPTTSTTVTQNVAAGEELCFKVQAIDLADQIGDFSSPKCTAHALDDRSLWTTARHTRLRSALGIRGTYTQLHRKGSSLNTSGRQTGRTLGLWVIEGPRLGTADIRVGNHRAGRIDLRANRTRRALLKLKMPVASGVVSIIQAGTRPVSIDALTMIR